MVSRAVPREHLLARWKRQVAPGSTVYDKSYSSPNFLPVTEVLTIWMSSLIDTSISSETQEFAIPLGSFPSNGLSIVNSRVWSTHSSSPLLILNMATGTKCVVSAPWYSGWTASCRFYTPKHVWKWLLQVNEQTTERATKEQRKTRSPRTVPRVKVMKGSAPAFATRSSRRTEWRFVESERRPPYFLNFCW